MNKTSIRTYANAIKTAILNRRAALAVELAVSFAVLWDSDGNKRLAREALCQIYTQAGYKASDPQADDWRLVNRHIAASFALYDFLGADQVATWAAEGNKLDTLVDHIKPLKLATVNEIMVVTEKRKLPRARASTPVKDGEHRIETEHLHFIVPAKVTRTEVIQAAMQLMTLAEEMAKIELKLAA